MTLLKKKIAFDQGKTVMFRRCSKNMRHEIGQSLVEYALILVLIAMAAIFVLSETGLSINNIYCGLANALGGPCDGNGEGEGEGEEEQEDVVGIMTADYFPGTQTLHLDATSDGGWVPGVMLNASPGGVMENRNSTHYHLHYILTGCPCTVTVTSSKGGSATVTVGN